LDNSAARFVVNAEALGYVEASGLSAVQVPGSWSQRADE